MFLEIITPDRTALLREVTAGEISGSQGSFEVLNNHAALISNLDGADPRCKDSEGAHISLMCRAEL